jgi:hypothetical protein
LFGSDQFYKGTPWNLTPQRVGAAGCPPPS